MKRLQRFLLQRLSRKDQGKQSRIGNKASSQHDPVRLRESLRKHPVIFFRKNIAVITDRCTALRQGMGKGRKIRAAAIKILPYPWMHDQLRERILVIHRKKLFKLFSALHPDSCLDRDPHPVGTGFKDLIQKPQQIFRIRQKARPLFLGDHSLIRAAKVQIHFPVSHFAKMADIVRSLPALVAKKLGDHRHPAVIVRVNLSLLPAFGDAVLIHCEKRRKVFADPAVKHLMKRIPVKITRYPLQRGKIKIHAPLPTALLPLPV